MKKLSKRTYRIEQSLESYNCSVYCTCNCAAACAGSPSDLWAASGHASSGITFGARAVHLA